MCSVGSGREGAWWAMNAAASGAHQLAIEVLVAIA